MELRKLEIGTFDFVRVPEADPNMLRPLRREEISQSPMPFNVDEEKLVKQFRPQLNIWWNSLSRGHSNVSLYQPHTLQSEQPEALQSVCRSSDNKTPHSFQFLLYISKRRCFSNFTSLCHNTSVGVCFSSIFLQLAGEKILILEPPTSRDRYVRAMRHVWFSDNLGRFPIRRKMRVSAWQTASWAAVFFIPVFRLFRRTSVLDIF